MVEESKGSMKSHSLEDVKRIIGNKADLYEAAVRNGWYMPKFKSTIITEDYITRVITGRVYSPKYSDIKLMPCPKPPEKEVLLADFTKLMTSHKKSAGIDDNHVPDKGWLLAILGTYNPKLPYFDKGYVPPAKVGSIQHLSKVELPESFLDGLPASKRKVKARHLKMITGSKTEAKMNRFKMLKEHFAKAYIKEQNKAKETLHRKTLRVPPQ
jgi:hypothetical protein